MVFDLIIDNKKRKICFLKIRLKTLERKKIKEINSIILGSPGKASKTDDIEKTMSSLELSKINFKINAVKRLIDNIK